MTEEILIIVFAILLIVPRFFISKLSPKRKLQIRASSGILLLGLLWILGDKEGKNLYILIGLTVVVIASLVKEFIVYQKRNNDIRTFDM